MQFTFGLLIYDENEKFVKSGHTKNFEREN